jgi:hypothetical protein
VLTALKFHILQLQITTFQKLDFRKSFFQYCCAVCYPGLNLVVASDQSEQVMRQLVEMLTDKLLFRFYISDVLNTIQYLTAICEHSSVNDIAEKNNNIQVEGQETADQKISMETVDDCNWEYVNCIDDSESKKSAGEASTVTDVAVVSHPWLPKASEMPSDWRECLDMLYVYYYVGHTPVLRYRFVV